MLWDTSESSWHTRHIVTSWESGSCCCVILRLGDTNNCLLTHGKESSKVRIPPKSILIDQWLLLGSLAGEEMTNDGGITKSPLYNVWWLMKPKSLELTAWLTGMSTAERGSLLGYSVWTSSRKHSWFLSSNHLADLPLLGISAESISQLFLLM